MKTKYILIGGYPRKAMDGGKKLADEMIAGFAEPLKLLLCYFARPKMQWAFNAIEDRLFFKKHLPKEKITFQTAHSESFLDEIRWADVIYIRGGDTDKLRKVLNQCPGWEKELDGKTLAGSSAGAHLIATCHYSLADLRVSEGLGLVPVKVLTHYRSNFNAPRINWDKAEAELKDYKENLPLLTLAEGQFEVLKST